jgi:predicted transcriptional regulator of viral defense system
MGRMKPKGIALIQELLSLNKPYFSLADLEKVLGQRRPSLYVTLNRLVESGVLVRLRRGVYQVALRAPDLPRIANQLVYPSYLSFEAALSRYGILSQIPYVVTFATPQRSRRLVLGDTTVEFRQLKRVLFFGYTLESGLYVAEPEKALLDQLYMASRGLASLAWDELELSMLDRERLRAYATHFPATVQAALPQDAA